MKLVTGDAICACGWHGTLSAKAPCPSCGRPAIDRMNAGRIAALRAVQVQADAPIDPTMRIRLVRIGVIKPTGKRPPPSPGGRHSKPPRREHALTALGLAVLATAEALGVEPEKRAAHRFVSALTAHDAEAPRWNDALAAIAERRRRWP